jgi:hypothetical protein
MIRCARGPHHRVSSRLNSPLIFTLLLCVTLAGCWSEPGKFNWKNAPGAEQYEKLMWQAIREKQWQDVQGHLAPAFVGVASDGRNFDGSGWLGYWKGVQLSDFSLGELAVTPNGADMVVTYSLNLNGGAAPPGPLRVVSVWQQVKRGWVLISQTETPVKSGN